MPVAQFEFSHVGMQYAAYVYLAFVLKPPSSPDSVAAGSVVSIALAEEFAHPQDKVECHPTCSQVGKHVAYNMEICLSTFLHHVKPNTPSYHIVPKPPGAMWQQKEHNM